MSVETTPADESRPEDENRPVDRDSMAAWRGVGAEQTEDISEKGTVFLRQRSRRLLGDLLRPYKKLLLMLALLVLLENAARLSVPLLVSRGIDFGVPPLLEGGSARVLYETVGVMIAAIVVQAVTRIGFLNLQGRVGQEILLEIRRRLFKHFQKLDVKFHDRYTSGRVVSRLTNDIDAIAELLVNGFDGLVTAVLTMVGVGILLLTLDFKLGGKKRRKARSICCSPSTSSWARSA